MYKAASRIVCSEIQLKNFRCFETITVFFDHPIVVLEGLNGAGKTSLLEALYYACYLRSFRTHLPKELVRFEQEHFFVRIKVTHNNDDHEIQVGFSPDKRSVKIDKKSIGSYKELMSHYRVVSLIEDDLNVIKGGPQERRSFVDQTLLLLDSTYIAHMKELRIILNNRTRLIQRLVTADDNYFLWTRQLWEKSQIIQQLRSALLAKLMAEVNDLVRIYFNDLLSIACVYEAKYIKKATSCDQFLDDNPYIFDQERTAYRSLFGAHLDDFSIKLENKQTKRLASRGQQKLILLLLKIAQARYITEQKGPVLFLLDDFMADFDIVTSKQLLSILYSLDCQLIFTTPVANSPLSLTTREAGAQIVTVTHSIKEPN